MLHCTVWRAPCQSKMAVRRMLVEYLSGCSVVIPEKRFQQGHQSISRMPLALFFTHLRGWIQVRPEPGFLHRGTGYDKVWHRVRLRSAAVGEARIPPSGRDQKPV